MSRVTTVAIPNNLQDTLELTTLELTNMPAKVKPQTERT